MQILKIVLSVIYFIICFAIIVLAMMQSKEDAGLSSTITGSSSNNFFDTREGKQKKWTIILGIVLVILCIGLGTIYML